MRDGRENAPTTAVRRGRRARPLTESELAERERLRREYEQAGLLPTSAAGGAQAAADAALDPASTDRTATGAADAASASAGHLDSSTAPGPSESTSPTESTSATESAAHMPEATREGAQSAPERVADPRPSVRRMGRRARVIEIDEEQRAGAPGGATPLPAANRDADGVELGEMSAEVAPDPRPAPRFTGRVLNQSTRARNRSVWMAWLLIAIAIAVLIVLLVSGVLTSGSTSAAAAAVVGLVGAPTRLPSLTAHDQEVDPA